MVSNKEIIEYLTSKTLNAGFVDKLKIKYRPIICPFDTLLGYAAHAESVFDIGCGSGQFCSLIAKFTPVTKISGVEISDKLVKNAFEVNAEFAGKKEMHFQTFDGKTLPENLKDHRLIYLIDVIHHVPQPQQIDFLKEIYAKMSVGSTLVFKDINGAHPFVYFNKLHDIVFAGEIGKEMKYLPTKKILEDIGFKIKEHYTKTIFVYPHYFLICEK